jgi:solute:Na+ symporter, SSS family
MRFLFRLLAALLIASAAAHGSAEQVAPTFNFPSLPDLPRALHGAFAGTHQGVVLVAGGVYVDGVEPSPSRDVYALRPAASSWERVGELPEAVAWGGSASHGQGLICVGGLIDGEATARVMRVSLVEGRVRVDRLPDLPTPVARPGAAISSNALFVAGGRMSVNGQEDSGAFLRLDLAEPTAAWESLPSWPGAARSSPVLVGLQGTVFLFGGSASGGLRGDAYSYTSRYGWRELTDPPSWFDGVAAAAFGQGHIFFFGGRDEHGQASSAMLAYHAITDRWIQLDDWPAAAPGYPLAVSRGSEIVVVSDRSATGLRVLPLTPNFGFPDHAMVVLYLAGMIWIGFHFSRREKTTKDYFRAGNRIPWWAAGMSLFATGASAISLMSMPGKSYSTDWTYFSISISAIIALPFAMYIMAPLVRRLKISTSNEYLERRFGVYARILGSLIFSLTQVMGRMGPVMLLPSFAIAAVTGISVVTCILIMGVITTFYTYLGGLEAVIWTDTVQGFVMIASVTGCLILAVWKIDQPIGQLLAGLSTAPGERLHMIDLNLDITYPVFWVFLISSVIGTLSGIGDQNFVQRVQSTPSLKQTRMAVATQIGVAVPINILLFSLGTVLYLFYQQQPQLLNPAMETDSIYPFFVAQQLPVGVSGLVIAALLAATMSTVSSSICSVANLGVEDFYRRFSRAANDRKAFLTGKVLTAVLGLFGTGAALWLSQASMPSVWDLAMLYIGLISNGVLGLFALGLLTKRANQIGALTGVACGMLTVYYLRTYTPVTFFLYPLFGSTVTFVVGYLVSLLSGGSRRNLEGLTVYTLRGINREEAPPAAEPVATAGRS